MKAYIVSDEDILMNKARKVLVQNGYECAQENILKLDTNVGQSSVIHEKPSLIVVILSANTAKAMEYLYSLRSRIQTAYLVVGPTTDANLVLRALRAGVDDFVDDENLDNELSVALSKLRNELPNQNKLGKVVALLGVCGGCGTSTITANISAVLAKEMTRVLLLDLNLVTGDSATLFDLTPTYTLADLCLNSDQIDRVMLERSLACHTSGVHVLAAPNSIADVARVNAAGVKQTLTIGRLLFPYVIVDLDRRFTEEQIVTLGNADFILLVFRLDFTSLRHTQRMLTHLRELGIPDNRLSLIVNRNGVPNQVSTSKAEESLKRPILIQIPEDAATVSQAINEGVPVILGNPSAKVSRSLVKLASLVHEKTKV